MFGPINDFLNSSQGSNAKKMGAVLLLFFLAVQSVTFWKYSQRMAKGMSQPSIMFQATLRDGTTIIVDDYREAYWWLRENTTSDARVLSWWDYGRAFQKGVPMEYEVVQRRTTSYTSLHYKKYVS